jgi:hypothetical protein
VAKAARETEEEEKKRRTGPVKIAGPSFYFCYFFLKFIIHKKKKKNNMLNSHELLNLALGNVSAAQFERSLTTRLMYALQPVVATTTVGDATAGGGRARVRGAVIFDGRARPRPSPHAECCGRPLFHDDDDNGDGYDHGYETTTTGRRRTAAAAAVQRPQVIKAHEPGVTALALEKFYGRLSVFFF